MRTRGRGESQIPKILRTSYVHGPLPVQLKTDPTSLAPPRYGELDRDEGREKLTGVQLFKATYKHMKKPFQLLIIPLTFWSGVEQGFFGADFTAVSELGLSISHPRMKSYHTRRFYSG